MYKIDDVIKQVNEVSDGVADKIQTIYDTGFSVHAREYVISFFEMLVLERTRTTTIRLIMDEEAYIFYVSKNGDFFYEQMSLICMKYFMRQHEKYSANKKAPTAGTVSTSN